MRLHPAGRLQVVPMSHMELPSIAGRQGRSPSRLNCALKPRGSLNEPNIEAATANVRAAGLQDRISIRHADAAGGLPGRYDVITTFDVVHDAVDPRGMLRAICQALEPNGSYLCLEINCAEKPEDNRGPIGAPFQGCSVLLCRRWLTTAKAWGRLVYLSPGCASSVKRQASGPSSASRWTTHSTRCTS
jgi:hypothetical protein